MSLDEGDGEYFTGGEMAERIRAFDWSTSPLGPTQHWCPALKSALGMVLASRHPMLIFWGADSRCFYNDACSLSFDPGKHAVVPGAKAAEQWQETWQLIGPHVDHVFSGGGAIWHENQPLPMRRNGRQVCAYWTLGYSPIPDPGAARGIGGVLVVCTETTQQMLNEQRRAQAEAALELTTQRLATLANAMPQLVWIGRQDGTLEYVNRRLCDYTGHSEADAKRFELWRQIIHPEDIDKSMAIWSQAVPRGEPYTIEQRLRRRDGVYRWFLVRAEPERDAAGQVVRWYGTCTDIDEAKHLERHLVTQESLLREADQRKDRFLATLSHELRNPLAPIRNAAQILGLPALPPQRLNWAQAVIKRQVTHMAWLLDDLLDVARITQGKLELKKSLVSLQSIVDAAVETTQSLLEERRHHLAVCLPADVPLLDADPVRLSQVLANLLNNAAKYTDCGGRIELSASVEGNAVRISVKDNGIGIPPQSHDRIFEMFSQIGCSTHAEGGLGIGLSLVKGLVALHGGTTQVASDGAAHGSEFTIRLPLPVLADPTDNGASAPELPPCAMRRRVLIADDNADAADSLAMLVELDGHEVRVAHGGRAALEVAEEFRPQVALLDIGMPDLTGYQVAEALRQEAWGRTIELVALTGLGQDQDRRRSKAAGFDRHLTKPIDMDELTGMLSQARR
jgi:PAS domain S-box-containing protein